MIRRRADQRAVNEAAWAGATRWLVRLYARGDLRPAEQAVLAAHRDELAGRTLELGPGAGRLTRHLVALGGEVCGLDISPAMVRRCRRELPEAEFSVGDMRDLSRFATASFDAVVASYNVIDVFGPEDRRATLEQVRRVLRPGGLLVLCTHNLANADAGGIAPPTKVRRSDPLRLAYDAARVPLRLYNHRRLRRLEYRAADHAVINDISHNFAMVMHYVDRDAQTAQLARAGFAEVACVDRYGAPVAPGEHAPHSADLHFVARAV